MELLAEGLHFEGKNDRKKCKRQCALGGVTLRIGSHTVCEAQADTELCLSAAAIRFLRTLFENHFAGSFEPLIPREDARMLPSEEEDTVFFDALPLGVDLDVIHEDGLVVLRRAGMRVTISYGDYRAAVIRFARQVKDFHLHAPKRRLRREQDRLGYELFLRELIRLLTRAKAGLLPRPPHILPPSASQPAVLSDREIKKITVAGMETKAGHLIPFREAAYHFYRLNGGDGRYLGEMDLLGAHPCIRLYTHPDVTDIHFLPSDLPFRRLPPEEERIAAVASQIAALGYHLCNTADG